MKKFNEQNMKAIYSKDSDKVYIAYGSKRVMNVTEISKHYDIAGKNGMQIAEIVFNANKKMAKDIVLDYLGA